MATYRSARSRRWTPAAIPIGMLLMLLGAWVFFAPLVGPYFHFGFFTNGKWVLSATHWELLLVPGIALLVGGFLMTLPSRGIGSLGGLLTLAAGAWLVAGPSVHPLWSSRVEVVTQHSQGMTTLLWVGYFYGAGAVAIALSSFAQGMLARRTVIEEMPVVEETPIERRESVVTQI